MPSSELTKQGEIGKAAALIKATEIRTSAAKVYLNYSRPLLIDGSTTRLVPDNVIAQDGAPYSDSGGVFPSGHTNTGFIDRVLLAEMLPKRLTCSAPF